MKCTVCEVVNEGYLKNIQNKKLTIMQSLLS